jgi:DNA-binding transcriptional regulator YdaS (Cro superfamily)
MNNVSFELNCNFITHRVNEMEATKINPLAAIRRAASNYETQRKFALVMSVSEVTVSHWLSGMKRPSYKHALQIEEITGITRHEIRPDIYS